MMVKKVKLALLREPIYTGKQQKYKSLKYHYEN